MKKLLVILALILTTLPAFLLLVANLAPFIPPSLISLPQFLGIIYPYLILANLILAIVWIIRKDWIFLIPVIAIITGFNHLKATFATQIFEKEQLNNNPSLKIMTFNVRLFDLYNWTNNKNSRDLIVRYLQDEDPDIICFQEYYHDLTNDFETTTLLEKKLRMRYYHIAPGATVKDLYWFGLAIYSKYPIIRSGNIEYKNSTNNAQWVDIKFKSDTLRIFNLHLESNRLGADDYAYLNKLNNSLSSVDAKKIKNIFSRLKTAYKRRQSQAELVAQKISQSPHPTIVCGDLNDTPTSYSYRKIRSRLSDAFICSGFGFGHTYGRFLTSARIDYIFYDSHFKSFDTKTGKSNLSDHKPVWTILEKIN
ncbi:MAG TPA: endonuclease/exonuclease/phosphatase family protein [Salinivirgaceae bacterium]|nr:endonuclease/exonuclease/phosphatase family protein [Salinivirgaceae bacterium]